ncbi:MAG: hypothetical protein ABIS03_08475 [Gemmatimonadaceae bacterium]
MRSRTFLLLPLVVLASFIPSSRRCAGAQGWTGIGIVDSSAVARRAWGAAVKATRENDVALADREVQRAATAWPTQAAYVWARAVMGAQRGESAAIEGALRTYADLGLGRDIRKEASFATMRKQLWFESLARRHDANRRTISHSKVEATLVDSTLWPEGVTYNPRTGSYYIASVRHRTIVERAPNGRERELWPRHRRGIGAILGVRVDPGGEYVWATTSGIPQMEGFTPDDSTIAGLLKVRIADGVIVGWWKPGGAVTKHNFGDLAVGPDGDVFMTDSESPVLYRLRPETDSLEPMRHPLFRSLQGVAPSVDGRMLFVADYSHGLLRIDLATGEVTRITDAPLSTSLGCDGIVVFGNSIVAVQNGVAPARVMQFFLNGDGTRIVKAEVIDRNADIADEPTIGTIVGNRFVYVANSQWDKHDGAGMTRAGARLLRPVLLSLPLKSRADAKE